MTPLHPLIARTEVTGRIHRTLTDRHRVVLCGPAGIGKTVLLEQTLAALADSVILRAYPGDKAASLATLAELCSALDSGALDTLSGPRRDAVDELLRLRRPSPAGPDTVALQLALRDLLIGLSAQRPVWVVIDAAERCDADSIVMLAQLFKHVPPDRLRAILTTRDPDVARRLELAVDQELVIPSWGMGELSELLAPLPTGGSIAGLHRASGGIPDLAIRIAGSMADGNTTATPALLLSAAPFTQEQLSPLSQRARHTLLLAAVSLNPSDSLLQRAGCDNARADLVAAARLGLIDLAESGRLSFHAEATAEVLGANASGPALAAAHRALAAAEDDPIAAVRHRALAEDQADAELAAELEAGAAVAEQRGRRMLAAELALLAAERTPADDQPAMVRRLVLGTRHASWAGRVALAERVAAIVLARATDPADRLKVQFAVINAVGQDFGRAQEIFAEASLETETDPVLQAELTLWKAWRSYICEGDLAEVLALAEQAWTLAERSTDTLIQMHTLTMVARMQRSLGQPAAAGSLDRALRLEPATINDVAGSPRFAAARHAVFDDRLAEARRLLSELLPVARRLGELKSIIEVQRSLTEVELRSGNGNAARGHLEQMLANLGDSDLSPAPSWYMASLVESNYGDCASAIVHARNGLRAAREDHDVVFTARNLFALGIARLRTGDTDAALVALKETAALEKRGGVGDPSILPWHGELAEALVLTGQAAQAQQLLDETRTVAKRLSLCNVLARLDLAEASCRIATGDVVEAAHLLTDARHWFADHGLRIDQGRAILAMAQLERRRRRRSTARSLLDDAQRLFEECGATAWCGQVGTERDRMDCGGESVGGEHVELTAGESRLVALVGDGASNRQAATALGISVKTVEATLTRIYRKLGVQTRTQLARYIRVLPPVRLSAGSVHHEQIVPPR